MKLYLKWFYWYKNFWDEMLFFWLLNYLQKEYNPESFTVEVWNKQRIQNRIHNNKSFLNKGIIDKLDFVENAVVSKRFRQLQSLLWIDKYRDHFKVFGWWEVLDESRKFPHNWWNLFLLHNYSIRKKNFILVGWIGTDKKKQTKKLYRYLLPRAKKIICREEWSVKLAKKYSKNVFLYNDFSKNILNNTKNIKQEKTALINVGPKYYTENNIQKIRDYIKKHDKHKKIFFPADINFDKEFYPKLRKIIPDLEIYDRTRHSLWETIDLFASCSGGVGSRLHFLYPLKFFNNSLVSISDSNKVKKMI